MTNDVSPAAQVDKEQPSDNTEQVTELDEFMEMLSPGTMLSEARKALSLSQEFISSKLNLKVALVKDIENDIFDPSMPVTFNRGYLANYAKLVGVEVEDILASYDALDAATIQRSEMLSFSKETSKQAEHSRVMWLSYFIVAVFIGLTVLWWLQESRQQADESLNITEITETSQSGRSDSVAEPTEAILNEESAFINDDAEPKVKSSEVTSELNTTTDSLINEASNDAKVIESTANTLVNEAVQSTEPKEPILSTAIFTFKGDCWVNIYDATGERIAWGVKKSGYVMTIQGKAPLRITVGKPELTSIIFNDQPVDMSAFDIGNIAKFNLPIVE
ncbi:RodZ domain-containing protein [Colwellia psychrerythraea]|uniref:Putative transcriptional regulator n=1 Tax=Colwellia psychrerythraea TaxID=28229 RepID=A0A099L023_COLPS|nr:RodZ domain-containing protein [Colwellia psychrerythraea]KGJ95467.1 putative transcriptional regulator [Colwellia psychrerythraea]